MRTDQAIPPAAPASSKGRSLGRSLGRARAFLRFFAAFVAVLSPFAPPERALAYEDTIEFGVAAGYAYQLDADEGERRHGLDLSALADFGLNDAWSLRAFAQHQLIFPSAPQRKTALLFEAAYALDIVRVVPIIGVGIGAATEYRGGERAFMPAASAFISIDILLGRWGLIAPELRFLATPFTGFDDTASLSLSAGLRFALLWDRF